MGISCTPDVIQVNKKTKHSCGYTRTFDTLNIAPFAVVSVSGSIFLYHKQPIYMSTTITPKLQERCEGLCELCTTSAAEVAFAVSPKNNDDIANEVAICETCLQLMTDGNNNPHWQCLGGSIWNSTASVQALSYRILYSFREKEWASDILNSTDLDEEVINWAMSSFEKGQAHVDSNGTALANGDTVVLTQLLNVKGASFMAPKGTVVKKIRLVPDNAEHIEGKINDQTIVILTKYVRKS